MVTAIVILSILVILNIVLLIFAYPIGFVIGAVYSENAPTFTKKTLSEMEDSKAYQFIVKAAKRNEIIETSEQK